MCEVCSQRFNSRGSLRRHHLSIHSEGCNFICQTCGAKYFEKEAYIGHVNKHIGSKPYSCAQCGDKFWYKSCWRRHLQTCPSNPRRKQYKCDTCGVVLNSKAVLLDHVQGKHGSKFTNARVENHFRGELLLLVTRKLVNLSNFPRT